MKPQRCAGTRWACTGVFLYVRGSEPSKQGVGGEQDKGLSASSCNPSSIHLFSWHQHQKGRCLIGVGAESDPIWGSSKGSFTLSLKLAYREAPLFFCSRQFLDSPYSHCVTEFLWGKCWVFVCRPPREFAVLIAFIMAQRTVWYFPLPDWKNHLILTSSVFSH